MMLIIVPFIWRYEESRRTLPRVWRFIVWNFCVMRCQWTILLLSEVFYDKRSSHARTSMWASYENRQMYRMNFR